MDFKIIKTIFVGLIIIVFILLNKCDNPLNNDNNIDIYVAGHVLNNACYWKNANKVSLTDGTKSSKAHSIAISEGDIYVAGYENNVQDINAACYWKNGRQVPLTDKTKGCYAYSIAISDNM